ncbi:peptide chain release factor N(5)-glutamine methyltransferase, partial [Aeromonas lusitana]
AGEPIAHLVGEREFWSLPLKVSPATLIPRPDTEVLVEQALARLPVGPCAVLDLGTGTGAIALAIKSERPDLNLWAVDRMPEAAALARANSAALGLPIEVRDGSWFEPLSDAPRFAMIVSNPPYIDGADPHLNEGDVRFEPRSALVADEQGLADIRLIVAQAPAHLLPGGWLLLEHGWQQGEMVRQLLLQHGYREVASVRDYGDNERVTLGCLPHE